MGAKMGTKGSMSEINLTPLIDILLVVMIIMMVAIPVQIEEMTVKLPSQTKVETKTDVPVEQLVIAVYDDNTLALNRRTMTQDVLFYEVTRRLRPMDKKNVFIDAAPSISYGQVVDMMDLAREAGASRVGLARLKDEGPLPPTSVSPGTMPKGVTVGSPNTVGAISEKNADESFDQIKGKVNGCYDSALARKGDLSGRVMLRISIAPDGTLMEQGITSSNHGDDQLDACVLQAAEQLTYEPLGEGKTAVVQYPLLFSPG